MAVDLCVLGMETNDEGGDGKKTSPEQPTATGDAAIFKKGAWSKEEDEKLRQSVEKYGLRNWVAVEKYSGLGRPAKNCRLRWLNYLRPNLKKYPFTQEEEDLIFELHSKYGNSWSRIASKLPGRSDNEIKNFWHKRSNKRHKHQHQHPIYPATNTTTTTPQNHPNENDGESPSSFSTPPSPSTPQPQASSDHASQTQSLLISPNPRTPSTPVFSRKPPILSSPHGRFSRATAESSPNSAHCPFSPNEPSFLPQDSSLQPRFSLPAMESPRSPLKLNLSSAQINTQTTMDSQTACFSGFQLQSPNTVAAPLSPLPSPLKLRLSIPIPSEFCFQSSLPNPNQSVQFGQDWHTIQHTGNNVIHQNSSFPPTIETMPPSIQVESDNSFEIMKELREAQARVEFLKEKLKLKHVSHKRSSSTNDLTEGTLDGNSNESTTGECTLHRSSSATENFLIPRVRITPHKNRNITRRGDNMESEKTTYQNETMQIEESSMSFQEQRHSIDFFDHLNMQNTVNVNASNSDYFIDKQCQIQGHECSSTTDSLYTFDPIDQGGYFNYSFGQEISDSLMDDGADGVLGVKTMFCDDSNLNFLETSSLVSAPIAEQEYFRGEQFSLQTTPGSGNNYQSPAANIAANLIVNLVDSICCPPQSEEHFVQGPSREQSSMMQGFMVDDNLWSQEQAHIFSTNRFHDQMESKNWNNVLSWDDAPRHVEVEQEHINTMSEELSSLLEFFPTTNQTQDWYNFRNATPDTKKLHMSSTYHQHPTHY